jgi:MFS family permease
MKVEMRTWTLHGRALVAAMCIGQLGNLLPHVTVPAIMAQSLMPLWSLSATEAGIMASAFAVGYMLAVPFLTTLTDRIDARLILMGGSALSGLATVAFGVFADGLSSAILIWGMAGIGFAGAYMPGLKALTDRLPTGDTSRSVTLYTASFSVGVGLSFLVAQLVEERLGWRAAFYVTGIGPFIMIAVCIALAPCKPSSPHSHLLDFAPVLAVSVSVLVTLLSLPASVLGNEAALRYGRHRAITIVMIASAGVALIIGLNVTAHPLILLALVLLYGLTVPADSGALTSGTSASAVPTHRGATLALHSTVGFGLSALGAWLAGVTLDAAGGPEKPSAWLAVFALLAVGILIGPLALWWSKRQGQIV